MLMKVLLNDENYSICMPKLRYARHMKLKTIHMKIIKKLSASTLIVLKTLIRECIFFDLSKYSNSLRVAKIMLSVT